MGLFFTWVLFCIFLIGHLRSNSNIWVNSIEHSTVLELVAQFCVHLFVTPWTVAHQAPLSMGFSRQEYCSGLPFPSPGDLSDPGIEPGSLTLWTGSLQLGPWGKPSYDPRLAQESNRKKEKKGYWSVKKSHIFVTLVKVSPPSLSSPSPCHITFYPR